MTMGEHGEEEDMRGIDPLPPAGVDDHESLVMAIHHRLMPNQTRGDGGQYQTIPKSFKENLAISTGGCSRDWASNTVEKRIAWWHRHYDNLRYFYGEGGSEGSSSTQGHMSSANEYWVEHESAAIRHAMTCFYRDRGIEERNEVIEAIGEDPTQWASYIAQHGQELVEDEDAEETEQVAQDSEEQVAEEGNSDQTEDEEILDHGDWIDHIGALPPEDWPLVSLDTGFEHARNRIVYGGPGTGKSHRLKEDSASFPFNVRRVTFHPDYTNGNFVGSYRPVPVFEADSTGFTDQSGEARPGIPGTPHILYEVTAGPFLDALVDANNRPEEAHLLIIEEINRANPSAVLGDVFQMLDRRDDGHSEYPVTLNPEIMQYLRVHIADAEGWTEVGLPPNLYIWATMNTTDEGVFPVDSAFRRRWTMEHVSVNKGESVVEGWQMPSEFAWLDGVSWNTFRTTINNAIIERTPSREDQLLGPFFFSRAELEHPDRVKNKLLDYLHQSLLRHSPGQLFRSEYGHGAFSRLMDDFDDTNVFRNIQFQDSASEDEAATNGGSPDGSAEEE
jgi:hypothetical protein